MSITNDEPSKITLYTSFSFSLFDTPYAPKHESINTLTSTLKLSHFIKLYFIDTFF
jgi:hypothetical protein